MLSKKKCQTPENVRFVDNFIHNKNIRMNDDLKKEIKNELKKIRTESIKKIDYLCWVCYIKFARE